MSNQEITNVDPKKKKTLEGSFNIQARETLDYEIARLFYSLGLPFHLAWNPHYRKTFSFVANNNCIFGYQPPSYNKSRITLLANERKHVENLLQPIKNTCKEKGKERVNINQDERKQFLTNLVNQNHVINLKTTKTR